jgi:hypothetical protein
LIHSSSCSAGANSARKIRLTNAKIAVESLSRLYYSATFSVWGMSLRPVSSTG